MLFRAALAASLLFAAARAEAVTPAPSGWSQVYLPATTSHVLIYVPAGLDRSKPAPMVLFLHGAGSYPGAWQSTLAGPANSAGVVIVAPKSLGIGWEFGRFFIRSPKTRWCSARR